MTALNIVGFPGGKLPLEVLGRILQGGQDKVHEAGALVVGGHTIIDEELKFGVAVTGAGPSRAVAHECGRAPGRPLGAHEGARHRAPRDGGEGRAP